MKDKKLYNIGYTNNLNRRLIEHISVGERSREFQILK
ncbi:MAG: hypothetical protein HYT13_01830 [Candidatus Liptonbacteria bacterium]|nr:hypothetical protein [Candidatus Liptonbacteria bacterium]